MPHNNANTPNAHKYWPSSLFMTDELVEIIETISLSMCGLAVILWMSIGTFSRSDRGEVFAQKTIAILCVAAALLLIVFNFMSGELWGSGNVALPMALVAVVVAISASMNLKGKDVQGETNPHEIMKMRKEER
ncbi:MAG: hypothetical protein CMA26_02405 [Euryarchaeota archaeon]|nr:hypothetical protein [Euryarchaeota archaeon]